MDSKGKPSLPHLSTNFPLLEQPPNAKIAAPIPERPRRTSSLFKEDTHDENIAPIPQPGCKPIFVAQKDVEHAPITKMKKLYYDDAFTTRGSHNSPTDRVTFESIVVAELKINTRVKDLVSKTLLEFSHSLTEIYQRPETSILVTIDQNADLLFGATVGPAYLLKVSALSCLIAPLTNLRNTTLIQSVIQDIFGIPPEKGVIIFNPVAEENLATNGITAREEIDRLERNDQSPSLFKSISRSMSRRLKHNSGNSVPLSLGSVLSPEAAPTNPRSPVSPPSVEAPPFQPRPDTFKLADPVGAKPSGEASSAPDLPKRTSSKSGKADGTLKKRESLKSFVSRRLNELGEITPFMGPKPHPKGKND